MLRVRYPGRLIIVIFAVFMIVVGACTPQPKLASVFSHQGRLLDADGRPVPDGDYTVEYKIYNVADAGTPEYTESKSVTVENGLFTTAIGLSSVITPTIFSKPTWLEITVDGETLNPRQPLQGSPYAFSLISGAVVNGVETIDREYDSIPNTGAALTVVNSDAAATGGHGLVVLNKAAAAGANRENVAALQARAIGGASASNTGAYGAIITSLAYRGLYAAGAGANPAGYFVGDIEVTGNCTGCTMAYYAMNSGDSPIVAGDFVTVEGVEVDADLNIPVMLVRKAAGGDPVIGVATGAAVRADVGEYNGVVTGGFSEASGPAAAGSYLSVVVQGLVQARAADASLQPGASLAASADGAVADSGGFTRALSAVDGNGMVWVMLNGQ